MDNTSYSTAGFRNKSILEALDSIQKSGYPSVEIGCGSHIDQPLKNEELNNFNKELNIKIFIGFTSRKSIEGFRWYNLNNINTLEMPTAMKKVISMYIKSMN